MPKYLTSFPIICFQNIFWKAPASSLSFFTRERALSFQTVLTFLLSGVQGAVQSELDQFFANLRNQADSARKVTAQAFYMARYKISALVFADVNRQLMALVEDHLTVPRWQGLRVIAADGSAVRLTLMKNGVRSIVEGVAFALYLPGIELFLDFALHEPLCNERQMLFEALDQGRAPIPIVRPERAGSRLAGPLCAGCRRL